MRNLLYLSLILLCISCTNKNDVRREKINYSVIVSDLHTSFPGSLIFNNNWIIWVEPFAMENIFHFIDAKTGKEIKSFGKKGNASNELISPSTASAIQDEILIYDTDKSKKAIIELNKIDNYPDSLHFLNDNLRGVTRCLKIGKNEYVYFNPTLKKRPFVYKKNSDSYYFGKYPIDDEIKDLSESYNAFQGEVCYNYNKSYLVYATYRSHYISVYEFCDSTFQLKNELTDEMEFRMDGDKISYDTESDLSIKGMTLTLNYIAILRRDVEKEERVKETYTRNTSIMPHSLFLYDYDLNLVKIVNLSKPIIRIAADVNSDVIYAIIEDEGFKIVKADLNHQ